MPQAVGPGATLAIGAAAQHHPLPLACDVQVYAHPQQQLQQQQAARTLRPLEGHVCRAGLVALPPMAVAVAMPVLRLPVHRDLNGPPKLPKVLVLAQRLLQRAGCSSSTASHAASHCEKTLPIIHKPSAVSKAPAAAAAGSVLLRQQVQHTSVQISSDRPTAYTRLGCTTRMFCRQAGAMDGANGWGNWQQHAAALPCSPGKQHSAAQCPHTQAASLFMLPHRTAAQLHAPQPAALGARAGWRG